jgi:hypothetical protein
MKTKIQLQKEGWLFITLSGGAIRARKFFGSLNESVSFTAMSMLTLRRKISKLS